MLRGEGGGEEEEEGEGEGKEEGEEEGREGMSTSKGSNKTQSC